MERRSFSIRASGAVLPGLDGVRAIAVLAVIVFHAEVGGLVPGGFLGVDIFFSLSGFLITSLLIREVGSTGRVDIGGFYIRRFRRLFPAMFVVVACSAMAALVWAPDALSRLRGDIPAALFYVSNWWQIHSGQSYFEMFGRPPLLQHLWSLAIEEQYYLVWPAMVLGAIRFGGARGVLWATAVLAIAASAWPVWLAWQQGIPVEASPDRLYLATDTHAMGLLIGSWLACVWDPWRAHRLAGEGGEVDARLASRGAIPRWVPDLLGLVAVAGLLFFFVYADESRVWLYRGGFSVLALLTCLLIVAASWPGARFGGWLGTPVLRWAGERSYSLYLWHWPVFVLLRPGNEVFANEWAAFALRLAVTVVLAELCFRFVENPLRHVPVRQWDAKRRAVVSAGALTGVFICLCVYVAPVADANIRVPHAPDLEHTVSGDQKGPSLPTALPAAAPSTAAAAALPLPGPLPSIVTRVADGEALLTAIGDSVLMGAQWHMLRALPSTVVDAQVGRQGREGPLRIGELREKSLLGPIVVIHLGTNGYLYEQHLREMLNMLADRERILVVNVHAKRRWTESNNQLLKKLVPAFPNAVFVDWDAVASLEPELMVEDGVHLTGKGIRAYVSLIAAAAGVQPGWNKRIRFMPLNGKLAEAGVDTGAAAEASAAAPTTADVVAAEGAAPDAPTAFPEDAGADGTEPAPDSAEVPGVTDVDEVQNAGAVDDGKAQ